MGNSKDKRYQAMRHDADTGKATPVSRFSTKETADKARQARRQELPAGSSDWFTAGQTRRKGRR